MIPAPIPSYDEERVAALRNLRLLDTAPEPTFDRITRTLACILKVPTALVSLVDADRQWFKSRIGLDAVETPRTVSFCGHVVASREPMFICDTHRDTRFADNPLVSANPRIRFYAGAPLITSEGYALGTLCAIDYVPREAISAVERDCLIDLAGLTVDAIDARAVSKDRKSTRLNSSHVSESRMPSSA